MTIFTVHLIHYVYVTSKDTDARVGHKTEERIIISATTTSGEKGDGPQLEALIKESRKNGMEVDFVVGDTAYSGKDNIVLSHDQDTRIFVCPSGHMSVRRAR